MMALKAYENDGSEGYENGGSERLWKWKLLTPLQMVALNAYENDDFERLWK